MKENIKRALWIIAGIIFSIFGIIGLMLPVIPQVPFLLAAGFCFTKVSRRFHRWITNNSLYIKYLEPEIIKFKANLRFKKEVQKAKLKEKLKKREEKKKKKKLEISNL